MLVSLFHLSECSPKVKYQGHYCSNSQTDAIRKEILGIGGSVIRKSLAKLSTPGYNAANKEEPQYKKQGMNRLLCNADEQPPGYYREGQEHREMNKFIRRDAQERLLD